MKNQKYGRSSSVRVKMVKSNENFMTNSRQSGRPAYEDKSLDMRERLELWRAEKRKQEIKDHNKLRQDSNTINHGLKKKSTPFASTSKACNKFKTPTRDFLSPSKGDTYKDPKLDMRRRLDLWLKEKGKTPQTPRLSKQRILKTASLTPHQRRKTWCFPQDGKERVTDGKTGHRSFNRGIPKTPGHTPRRTRKSCSCLNENKENMAGIHVAYDTSVLEKSPSVRDSRIVQEEEVLRHSLEGCFKMLNENLLDKQDEVVFTLDDIQRSYPNALRHAMYWICRAKLAENVGDHERVVCMFEQAIAFSAQPEEEIKNALSDYKNRKQYREEKKNKSPVQDGTFRTPHQTRSRELRGLDREMLNSSVVRFCLMDSTPFRTRRKSASEKRVLTPVRRTTRWERCGITHPKTIQEKNVTVTSLSELTSQLRSGLVFRPNTLLPCELDEEMQSLLDIDEF